MGTIFEYSVRVECDKKDVENIVKFFDDNMVCYFWEDDNDFYYEETNFGFVGEGRCEYSFIDILGDKARKLTKKYKCAIDMFGNACEEYFCEYMRIWCGKILKEQVGEYWNIDTLYDDEELLEEVLETIDKEDLTIDEIYDCELSDGTYIYEFYYDFLKDCREVGRLYQLPCMDKEN